MYKAIFNKTLLHKIYVNAASYPEYTDREPLEIFFFFKQTNGILLSEHYQYPPLKSFQCVLNNVNMNMCNKLH